VTEHPASHARAAISAATEVRHVVVTAERAAEATATMVPANQMQKMVMAVRHVLPERISAVTHDVLLSKVSKVMDLRYIESSESSRKNLKKDACFP
jgi:hypothetical protein